MSYCLAPSILSADYANLGDQVRRADQAGAHYIHIDVMDGVFVPTLNFGPGVVKGLRPVTDRILDVHLMVENPEKYIASFANAGADIITVHAEATKHLDGCIQRIKKEKKMAGVALNPATPLSSIEYVLDQVDMVLLMSVNPGMGGQSFIPYVYEKIEDLRAMIARRGLKTDIEVDGGIKLDNVERAMAAGANVLVAGSAVFPNDIEKNVSEFLAKMA